MKQLLLLGIAIILFTASTKQEKRYTQQSLEIDTDKKVIEAYEKQDWNAMSGHYADTAKILNNVTIKEAHTVAQLIAQNKEEATLLSSWKYDPESVEYEMLVTDKGETWVTFLGSIGKLI